VGIDVGLPADLVDLVDDLGDRVVDRADPASVEFLGGLADVLDVRQVGRGLLTGLLGGLAAGAGLLPLREEALRPGKRRRPAPPGNTRNWR
jgi:hypothetical protein